MHTVTTTPTAAPTSRKEDEGVRRGDDMARNRKGVFEILCRCYASLEGKSQLSPYGTAWLVNDGEEGKQG